jgi:hypothetical protein
MKKHLLFLLLILSGLCNPTQADTLAPPLQKLTAQLDALDKAYQASEANHRIEVANLQNEINANKNSVITLALPYLVTLAIGLVLYLFGNHSQKGKLKEWTHDRVDQQLQAIVPKASDEKLQAYLKKQFPGDLKALMLGAKMVAYDVELRQTQRIVLIGMNAGRSQAILDQLKADGFLQVEFRAFVPGMDIPTPDLLLIDRYSCKKSDQPMSEGDVEGLIKKAKALTKGSGKSGMLFVHYFGETIPALRAITDERHAFSNMPNTLIPNIMDQLRYAFPQNFNPA